jgi:tetratricopeptide (TPR) repeat protein
MALLEQLDEPRLLAFALSMRGYCSLGTGEIERMEQFFERGLALYQQTEHSWGQGYTLTAWGYATGLVGNANLAWQRLQQAEALLRTADAQVDLIINHNMQAMIAYRRGDNMLAAPLFRQHLETLYALRDTWILAYNLTWLATIAVAEGHFQRAARLFGAAEAMREATGAMIQFPPDRELYQQQVARVRAQLDPESFELLWAEGRAMSLFEAVTYAAQPANET